MYLQTKDNKDMEKNKGNILDLVRTPIMRIYTFVICFNWLVCGFCFFGVSQFIGQLGTFLVLHIQIYLILLTLLFSGGNIFVNVALSAIIQIPSTLFACWTTKAWGRKRTLIIANLLSGISFFLIGKFKN